ncbi:MAG: hypothetical protein NZO58_08905 [Gemmataceae bacterium]|nr:hypothetical protein [Gemmataceae bacterium]
MYRDSRGKYLRINLVLGAAALAVMIVGCSGNEPAVQVSGKVTFEGSPVDGEIIFYGPGDKEARGPILDGKYHVANPAVGMNTIVITKGLGGEFKPVGDPKIGGGGALLQGGGGKGVHPPAKYGAKETSDLKFEVKAGKQEKNFELTK